MYVDRYVRVYVRNLFDLLILQMKREVMTVMVEILGI